MSSLPGSPLENKNRAAILFFGQADYHRSMSREENQTAAVPLVEIVRGSMVESLHRGFISVVDSKGRTLAKLGETETPTWYRSAAKPFQTIPLITSGAATHWNLTSKELAVITASHSGEDFHLEAVNSILNKIGLNEADLLCGVHAPFDETTVSRLRIERRHPDQRHNNCSGKHSGMLAFAKFIGQPITDYINPSHPIQQQILKVIAEFADVSAKEVTIAIDGCSAPVFGVNISAMARSYARLVGARFTNIAPNMAAAANQVIDAMTGCPEMVGGSRGRLDTDLMRVTRGQIVSKVGAEGVQLLGVKPCQQYPHGLGVAIKIEDGDTRRARDPVVIETLRQLGALSEEQIAALSAYTNKNVFNHRKLKVGEVHTCFKL